MTRSAKGRTMTALLAVALVAALAGRGTAATWLTGDLDAAKKRAAEDGKMLLAVFWSDTSQACQRAERDVFSKPEFDQAAEGWVLVRIDVDKAPEAVDKYGLTSVPASIFFRPDGEELGRCVGVRALDEFTGNMRRAEVVTKHLDADPATLSEADAKDLVDALFLSGFFPRVIDVLNARLPAQTDPVEARRSRILLGAALAQVGDLDHAIETLNGTLDGAKTAAISKEQGRILDLIQAFELIQPAYVTPIAIVTPAGEFVGVLVTEARSTDVVVATFDRIAALARADDDGPDVDRLALGLDYLRWANTARAGQHLGAAATSTADDEKPKAAIVHMGAALTLGGAYADAIALEKQFVEWSPESPWVPKALCVEALAARLSNDEMAFATAVDRLHEDFENDRWYYLALLCPEILKSLDAPAEPTEPGGPGDGEAPPEDH
jgi:hypothetical protein